MTYQPLCNVSARRGGEEKGTVLLLNHMRLHVQLHVLKVLTFNYGFVASLHTACIFIVKHCH